MRVPFREPREPRAPGFLHVCWCCGGPGWASSGFRDLCVLCSLWADHQIRKINIRNLHKLHGKISRIYARHVSEELAVVVYEEKLRRRGLPSRGLPSSKQGGA